MYSQSGEDGVLARILGKIDASSRYFVEFGAWDGVHLSNTYILAKYGFAGCMIEGDPAKFKSLCSNMAGFPSVRCVNAWVTPSGSNSLENILASQYAPASPDVLSIDVDGDDYWIWKGLVAFRPKCVVIEINSRVKPGVRQINPFGSAYCWGLSGTSITSLRELADEKGYKLVVNVGCNAIFVDACYRSLFHACDISEVDAFTYEGFKLEELTFREKIRRITEHARKMLIAKPFWMWRRSRENLF